MGAVILEALRNAVLITGLVVVMMMMVMVLLVVIMTILQPVE
mgnify:CR=1 FL=1